MDTGKIAIRGYEAGAIKYTVLRGYITNPGGIIHACLATRGYGLANTHKLAIRGYTMPGTPPTSGKVYAIFGGDVIA